MQNTEKAYYLIGTTMIKSAIIQYFDRQWTRETYKYIFYS